MNCDECGCSINLDETGRFLIQRDGFSEVFCSPSCGVDYFDDIEQVRLRGITGGGIEAIFIRHDIGYPTQSDERRRRSQSLTTSL